MTETTSTALKTTIYIVDDHPLVRDWLSRLIHEEVDLQVSGWAESADEAIQGVEQLSPDIIIVDIGLRGKSGLELIRFLTDQNPDTKILVLSMHDEAVYAGQITRYHAEWARRIEGEVIPSDTPDENLLLFREPIGVVACLIPFNYPVYTLMRKVAPALITGNTVVVRLGSGR